MPTDKIKIVLGLGSNIGNRQALLELACIRLGECLEDLQRSTQMETKAILPENAPPEWNVDYLNMAVSGWTKLEPLALLAYTQGLEKELGRQFRGVWGPREIDIDILAYGENSVAVPELCIPHSQLLLRDFALKPLAELWPDWHYPKTGNAYGLTPVQLINRAGF